MTTSEPFRTWAIVEIFGHERIAGELSEQAIGGCSFVRVDVPAVDGQSAFTRMFGNGAIYSITPVSEEIARAAVARMRVKPVDVYLLPSPARPAADPDADVDEIEDGDEDDDYGDDESDDSDPGF